MNFFYDMDDASNLILWYDLYIRYGMATSVQPEDCSRKGDDKVVFSTSLSNEYSYLLFNLEQIKDAEGKQKYSRFQLLKWLDEIRRMGNEQSFAN